MNPRRRDRTARWSLQDAKNKLSAVVDAAAGGEPQIVTRRGVETAVVISYRDYERLTSSSVSPSPPLAEYLLRMPTGEDGVIERIRLEPRDGQA